MVDFHRWVSIDHGTGLPDAVDGAQPPPTGVGLGITIGEETVGEAFVDSTR
jgi:hypothetical protein